MTTPHPCQRCGAEVKKPDAPLCQRCAVSFAGHRQTVNNPRILRKAQARSVWAKKATALAKGLWTRAKAQGT